MSQLHFRQVLPDEGFVTGPNTVFYQGALSQEILAMMEPQSSGSLPPGLQRVSRETLDELEGLDRDQVVVHDGVRHLTSAYNTRKEQTQQSSDFHEYITTTDPVRKQALYNHFCDQFVTVVNVDPLTGLSPEGEEHGAQLSDNYAMLFDQHPEQFRDRIYISPYHRTRKTARYILKNITGLDLDVDQLLGDPFDVSHTGYWTGSFRGKDIQVILYDDIRERDHGKTHAPRFIQKHMTDPTSVQGRLTDQQYKAEHYFKSERGGEAQTQTNRRVYDFQNYIAERPQRTLSVDHHLVEVAKVVATGQQNIFNFLNFDHHRKPLNGSVSKYVSLPRTVHGITRKMRVAAYNLMLEQKPD